MRVSKRQDQSLTPDPEQAQNQGVDQNMDHDLNQHLRWDQQQEQGQDQTRSGSPCLSCILPWRALLLWSPRHTRRHWHCLGRMSRLWGLGTTSLGRKTCRRSEADEAGQRRERWACEGEAEQRPIWNGWWGWGTHQASTSY